MGIDPVTVTPEEYAMQIKENVESFKKLVDDGAVAVGN